MADNLAENEELTGPDLDETLANTLREIEEREPLAQEEPEKEKEEPEPELEKEPEKETRDEHGRFKAKDKADTSEPLSPDDSTPDDAPIVSRETRHPPSSWSAKAKTEFAKLPDHIQSEVLKREDDFHKGIEQYREKAHIGDSLMAVIQPYQPYLRSKGATPEQTVTSMLQTAYALETASEADKPRLFAQVAKRFGVDLSNLAENQTETTPYIQQLERKLSQLQQQFQSQNQAAQQRTLTEAYGSIDAFRAEVDENGGLKHLYFDDVRDQMADMIEAAERQGRQLPLQDAYDAAIWSRPEIRESLLAEQQKQEADKRKKEQDRKAAEAKKRASVNVSTTGSHTKETSPKPGSIEETLAETYAAIQARDE